MKNLLLLPILFLFSCNKEKHEKNITVEQMTVNALNATEYVDQSYNLLEDGISTGIHFGCHVSVYNEIKVGHNYTLICSPGNGNMDTIAKFILSEEGIFVFQDNPNVNINVKYDYTCDGKGLKIYN